MSEENQDSSVVVERIKRRLHEQGKNALVLFVGDTGEGKSLSSIELAGEVDPSFFEAIREAKSSNVRIAHQKGSHFMKILNTQKLRRGNAVVWDDVGKGLKKRDWYELVNKAIVDVLQTFRIYGLCVIFNCPDPRLIDSNALALFHYWGEMLPIDFKRQLGRMKFFEIQINRRSGKMYYHYPRVRKGGKVKTITRLYLKRPPLDIEKLYEKDKRKVTDKLLVDTEKIFKKIESKEKFASLSDGEILNNILKDAESFLKTYNKRTCVDKYAIMARYRVGLPRANKIKAMAERLLFKEK